MTMTSFQMALIVLCIVFGGALSGILISRRLPPHHLSDQTKSVVSVSMAVVGTMSALVISLLISSASSSFTARNAEVTRLSSDIVQLDALLRRYGPEADAARGALRNYASAKFQDLFSGSADLKPSMDNPATVAALDDTEDLILDLRPGDERRRFLGAEALKVTSDVRAARSSLARQNTSSLPLPFLGAVVIWLAILFASFGLFAPKNVTVVVVLFLCAVVISAAIKLVLDMDTPFEGEIRLSRPPIRISSEPMAQALDVLRR